MILKARRAVRRVTLSRYGARTVQGAVGALVVLFGVGTLTGYASTETGFMAGAAAVLVMFVVGFGFGDECPECDTRVDAPEDQYCPACGTTLESLPYRPSDLDDVDDGRAAT